MTIGYYPYKAVPRGAETFKYVEIRVLQSRKVVHGQLADYSCLFVVDDVTCSRAFLFVNSAYVDVVIGYMVGPEHPPPPE